MSSLSLTSSVFVLSYHDNCREWCKMVPFCSCERVTFNVLLFTQGGMKAVVWTDVFQSVVMIAGLLAIMIQVLIFICFV